MNPKLNKVQKNKPLKKSFFNRSTLKIAEELLGKYIIVKDKQKEVGGFIVETEAYIGEEDKACHASRGRTKRTETMYQRAGTLYIYLIYGVNWCFNIVTERKNRPCAVLLRAIEPVIGLEEIKKNRKNKKELTNGPGKLCQALGITGKYNGDTLNKDRIRIEDRGLLIEEKNIVKTSRIGVGYAGDDALLPWRFYIKDNIYVSRR